MGGDQEKMICPLRSCALDNPNHTLLEYESLLCSAVTLDTWVCQYQVAMSYQGVFLGDKLAVLTVDPLETIILCIACLRSGVIFCPINPDLPECRVRDYCRIIQATWMCQFATSKIYEWELFSHFILPKKNYVATIPNDVVYIDPKIIINLIATSGTSGEPKAVAHNFFNHYYSAIGAQEVLPLTSEDTWLLSLPLYHVGGLAIIFRCLLAGARMIVYVKNKGMIHHLYSKSVSHLSLVNAQLYRLLNHSYANLSQLGVRYILLGGGAITAHLVKAAQQQGVVVFTTYGMSEMSSQVCTGVPIFKGMCVSSGCLLNNRQLMLSEHGEILLRGKPLSLGYYRHGGLQTLTDQQGWYHTGDLGEWYQGQIFIRGRADNMIVSGGENIHPEEIEQALMQLSGIMQAVVVGVYSREFGQRPIAYVQTENGTLNKFFIKRQLGYSMICWKIPDDIMLLPDKYLYSGIKLCRRFIKKLAKEV